MAKCLVDGGILDIMLPEYLDAIRAAGGIPVILPLTADDNDIHQLIAMVDGVLLTGGPAVS